jgi:tripartite-type tricarboxylate transporter receptor subunit TctC
MLAPAGLDKQIAGKLSADFIEALGDPSVKDKLELLGLTAVGSSQEDFQKLIVDEVKNNGDIVRQAGIRVD